MLSLDKAIKLVVRYRIVPKNIKIGHRQMVINYSTENFETADNLKYYFLAL